MTTYQQEAYLALERRQWTPHPHARWKGRLGHLLQPGRPAVRLGRAHGEAKKHGRWPPRARAEERRTLRFTLARCSPFPPHGELLVRAGPMAGFGCGEWMTASSSRHIPGTATTRPTTRLRCSPLRSFRTGGTSPRTGLRRRSASGGSRKTIHVFADSEGGRGARHEFAFWRARFLTLHYEITTHAPRASTE